MRRGQVLSWRNFGVLYTWNAPWAVIYGGNWNFVFFTHSACASNFVLIYLIQEHWTSLLIFSVIDFTNFLAQYHYEYFRFNFILKAPTSSSKKLNEDSITYLNQGWEKLVNFYFLYYMTQERLFYKYIRKLLFFA